MLYGRFIQVIKAENPVELVPSVKEGYLKIAWREDDEIIVGYVLVSAGEIVGALMENPITGETLGGQDAFGRILNAIRRNKIRVVELYDANVNDILSEKPEAKVVKPLLDNMPGKDLEGFLKLLHSYIGAVEVHNGDTSWRLYVNGGKVKAAKTTRGQPMYGDDAVRLLLREMGHIMKEGSYRTGDRWVPTSKEAVTRGELLREGVELLHEKVKFEKSLKRRSNPS